MNQISSYVRRMLSAAFTPGNREPMYSVNHFCAAFSVINRFALLASVVKYREPKVNPFVKTKNQLNLSWKIM